MNRREKLVQKTRIKILKFCLSSGDPVQLVYAKTDKFATLKSQNSTLKLNEVSLLDELASGGLVSISGQSVETTNAGKMHLRRKLSQVDEFQQQHRSPGVRNIIANGILRSHQSNEGESPLTRLRFRSIKNGKSYIDDPSYQAGERLRAEFTRGQLTQQLSSNWSLTQNEATGSNGRNGIADLSDTALAARKRTEAAIAAVGPEFAGILIDICCFLKGLELVEKERQWPPRSAKLMLKTGLSVLARHYGFSEQTGSYNRKPSASRHWGSQNYRPDMFPDQ